MRYGSILWSAIDVSMTKEECRIHCRVRVKGLGFRIAEEEDDVEEEEEDGG